jgi:hypothetical protein
MGTGSFLWVKRPRSGANYPPPSSAEVKKEWSYTSTPLWAYWSATGYLQYRTFHNVLRDYKHLQQKTKGPTLMELFTDMGKLKMFSDNYRCSICAPRVTRHTSILYSTSYQTRVNMDASIFFTAAMIHASRHEPMKE